MIVYTTLLCAHGDVHVQVWYFMYHCVFTIIQQARFYMSYRMCLDHHELETQPCIPCTPIKVV